MGGQSFGLPVFTAHSMIGLYLHFPFCVRKCPYCDFFSIDRHTPGQIAEYVELLLRHLELTAAGHRQGPLTSIFFGGGTPSLMSPEQIDRILSAAAHRFGLSADVEISLEANPGTVTAASLSGYRAAGVNRLSLGVQSLQTENLARLGRIHTPDQAVQALRLARRAGFENISCDLMFAQPGQTVAALEQDLFRLLDEAPAHLSCYGLTVEDGTPYHERQLCGELRLPDEEAYADQFLTLHHRLTEAGFEHYEISNYARPGRQCRHNLGYWRRRPCLGIGAGAHAFEARDCGLRLAVPADLDRYRRLLHQGLDPAEVLERFDQRQAMAETLYLGLRTAEGVAEAEFAARFGSGFRDAFGPALEQSPDYLYQTPGRLQFSLAGWLLFDHLILPFL